MSAAWRKRNIGPAVGWRIAPRSGILQTMSKHDGDAMLRRYRVPDHGRKFRLDRIDPDDHGGITKERAAELLEKDLSVLEELQEKLVAATSHAVLVVLQAMDTGGKDGT